MVVIWNKSLNCCNTVLKMTYEHEGIIAHYQNDFTDDQVGERTGW